MNCGFGPVAPHDLHRTCARLCHQARGELDKFNFFSDTCPFRRRSATLAASSDSECSQRPDRAGAALKERRSSLDDSSVPNPAAIRIDD